MKTVKETLTAAADLIEAGHWVRGKMHADKTWHEKTSPFGFKHVEVEYDSHCTLGALQHVAADGRTNDYHLPGTVGLTSAAAIVLAESMWPNEFKTPSLYVSKAHWAEAHIAQWNDHSVSNATEVAAKLRQAAEEYKE